MIIRSQKSEVRSQKAKRKKARNSCNCNADRQAVVHIICQPDKKTDNPESTLVQGKTTSTSIHIHCIHTWEVSKSSIRGIE